jgi:hypothetical protein
MSRGGISLLVPHKIPFVYDSYGCVISSCPCGGVLAIGMHYVIAKVNSRIVKGHNVKRVNTPQASTDWWRFPGGYCHYSRLKAAKTRLE